MNKISPILEGFSPRRPKKREEAQGYRYKLLELASITVRKAVHRQSTRVHNYFRLLPRVVLRRMLVLIWGSIAIILSLNNAEMWGV